MREDITIYKLFAARIGRGGGVWRGSGRGAYLVVLIDNVGGGGGGEHWNEREGGGREENGGH